MHILFIINNNSLAINLSLNILFHFINNDNKCIQKEKNIYIYNNNNYFSEINK